MNELPDQLEVAESASLGKPRYRQIFDTLKHRISTGEYGPGQKLPTEAELMRLFDVSRTTVSRAMRDMEILGLISRRRGSGTFVCRTEDAPCRVDLALFVPWVETGAGLPYVEGLIHQRLADMAGHEQATMLLQCLAPGPATLEDRMVKAAQSLIESCVDGVLYYPAELPDDVMQLNRTVVDMLVDAGIQVVLIDRDIVSYPERSEFTRVGYDNRRGGMLLTDHLINSGCRRIAFVGIPEVSTVVANRLSGFHEAHRVHGRGLLATGEARLGGRAGRASQRRGGAAHTRSRRGRASPATRRAAHGSWHRPGRGRPGAP